MSILFQIFNIFIHVRFAWTNLGTLFLGHKIHVAYDANFTIVVLTEDLTFLK